MEKVSKYDIPCWTLPF